MEEGHAGDRWRSSDEARSTGGANWVVETLSAPAALLMLPNLNFKERAIGVLMAPTEVVLLLAVILSMELAVMAMALAKISAISAIFVSIPRMVVVATFVVVASFMMVAVVSFDETGKIRVVVSANALNSKKRCIFRFSKDYGHFAGRRTTNANRVWGKRLAGLEYWRLACTRLQSDASNKEPRYVGINAVVATYSTHVRRGSGGGATNSRALSFRASVRFRRWAIGYLDCRDVAKRTSG